MGDQPANTDSKHIRTHNYVKKTEQNKADSKEKVNFERKKKSSSVWW